MFLCVFLPCGRGDLPVPAKIEFDANIVTMASTSSITFGSDSGLTKGTGGHRYGPIIDNDFVQNRRDRRTTPYNKDRRSTIRDRAIQSLLAHFNMVLNTATCGNVQVATCGILDQHLKIWL